MVCSELALSCKKKKKNSLLISDLPPLYTFLSQFLYKLISLGRAHFHLLTVSLLVSSSQKHIPYGDELHKVPGKCKWKGNGVSARFIADFSSSSQLAQLALRSAQKVSWNSGLIKSPPIGEKAHFR